jgi:hypothetical protein
MSRKVIYVSYMHLSDKVSRDWYIDYLIEKGVIVEFWDVVPLLREEYEDPGIKTTAYVRNFRTYSELEASLLLPENRNAYYLMLVYYEGRSAEFYKLLSKYDCKMLFISWGSFPIKSTQKWRTVLSGFSNPLHLAEKMYFRLKAIAYKKLKLVKPYEIVFAAGQMLMASKHYATEVIPINLVDYDRYRIIKSNGDGLVSGRYAVFLDINLAYQSDLKIMGWPSVNPSNYYASLNRFFELVELKYGIKVVIAAHPRASKSADLFNGREVFHGRTPELVKEAEFVIAHYSTSLSYVVLNSKPIMFIYTKEIEKLYKYTVMSFIRDFAEYFEAAIFNIDEITKVDLIYIRDVNTSCYENYKYSFLTTHESENTFTQDIIWHEVNA